MTAPEGVRVSPIDRWMLDRWTWSLTRDGYVRRQTSRKEPGRPYPVGVTVYLHREIMGLVPGDGLEVDHRDGDPLNNERWNLRVVTPVQNKSVCKTDPDVVIVPDEGVSA